MYCKCACMFDMCISTEGCVVLPLTGCGMMGLLQEEQDGENNLQRNKKHNMNT